MARPTDGSAELPGIARRHLTVPELDELRRLIDAETRRRTSRTSSLSSRARVHRANSGGATSSSDLPEDGKVFLAANPQPLAAEAQRRGIDTARFLESDLVPDGHVVIVDLDAIAEAIPPPELRLIRARRYWFG